MPTETPDWHAVMARLAAVERENKRLRRAILGIVVLALAMFGMAAYLTVVH